MGLAVEAMANLDHLKIFARGIEGWNQWREENPEIKPDLRGISFRRANLCNANLCDADLRGADLFGALLCEASFNRANLSSANLIFAYLIDADLRGADLTHSQVIGTSFKGADLTGACIKDWHITADTYLQDVICHYVFTGDGDENGQFTERRPHDPSQNFALGEFTKRYRSILNAVELFFNDGIDWKAFLASLEELQIKYGDELSIQGIEKKPGGTFLVRVEVGVNADKGAIEREVKESYAANLRVIEAKYRDELQTLPHIQNILDLLKNQEPPQLLKPQIRRDELQSNEILNLLREQNTNLTEIIKTFADRPLIIQLNAAQVQQNEVGEQHKEAKAEEKPPEKSKWNRMNVIVGFVGTGVLALLGWAVDATDKLQSISENWGIDIPGLIDSEEPDQSPSPSESPQP